ncbi:cupin domain-containing protein [Aquabacterium sp. J223]|uniref:cupin domain-containing protein n=1 Tax=Aquabacterium sp. J223 TaxID=2898431 RepID=UPI0021ADA64B|nr:cupin domain-containing protein [Aquabacterium sp. J223]UUX97328.1 cupin domain-containing protein [Aquabacterium sp. J223]
MQTSRRQPDGPAARARFVNRDGYYVQGQPPYAARAFVEERDAALAPYAPTGFVLLDNRQALGTEWPATTPLMLARYARVRRGEWLRGSFRASGEIYHVLAGSGTSRNGPCQVDWRAGDVFCFDGGEETVHLAGHEDALLWSVTDEPLLSFLGLAPARAFARAAAPLHFGAGPIAEALAAAQHKEDAKGDASNGNAAFIFSSEDGTARRCLPLPSLMLALNSLAPGKAQRPHRHNAAALTLVLDGERCHSVIDGVRHEWEPHTAIITPAGQMHTHCNEGERLARVLIAQDSGMHYYLRSSGFSYD